MAVENNSAPANAALERHGAVFTALRQILKPYEDVLAVRTDKPGHCYMETRTASLNGRRLFFGGAKVKKNYVSFYLMPLYMLPDLCNRISHVLKKLMQGQSCFNFTQPDQGCFDELNQLTESAFQKLKQEALL